MTEEFTVDLTDLTICRVCLKSGALKSICRRNSNFSMMLSTMFFECTNLEANYDVEPNKICKKCELHLISSYKFRKSAIEADLKLKTNLSKTKPNGLEDRHSPQIISSHEEKLENILTQKDTGAKHLNIECENINSSMLDLSTLESQSNNVNCRKADIFEKMESSETDKICDKQWNCDICKASFKSKDILLKHMDLHNDGRAFECDICCKKFVRSEHLVTHKRTHTGERPHKCEICSKSFVQYAALLAHKRVHNGERPYMCSICGKTFSQAVSLTYHTRIHSGETPYHCKICNKGFTHSGNLNIHLRFHFNDRPFSCSKCDKRFVTSSHLRLHLKQHEGLKPHECNICGKCFLRSEHLKDHRVIHTGQRPHACSLCPKRYTQSSHLKRHMKTHAK